MEVIIEVPDQGLEPLWVVIFLLWVRGGREKEVVIYTAFSKYEVVLEFFGQLFF